MPLSQKNGEIMKRLFDMFSSVRLTLALLLGLSLVAIGGTLWPIEKDNIQRYELYYQSLWFRLLLALLALNLAACTWRTFRRVWREKQSLLDRLTTLAVSSSPVAHPLPAVAADELVSRLQQQGYKSSRSGDQLLARRGLSGRWALPILHLSILAVMLGAWAAQLGFVGTVNMYVTHQIDTYFDWDVESQQPLGFSLRLDHFEPQYYPIELRFATIDPVTQETLQVYTAKEGETVDLGDGLTALVQRFFPEEEHLVLNLMSSGLPLGEYHALSGSRSYPNTVRLPVIIRPAAFRDPLLKQLHSEVSILENDQVVRQGIIEVNQPLVHRGVAIYQTAYSRDESGFWTCGFQLSKDPGEPVVWLGSIILSLALVLVFTVRLQALGLVPSEQGWQVVPLTGFRGDVGAARLQSLVAALGKVSLPDREAES